MISHRWWCRSTWSCSGRLQLSKHPVRHDGLGHPRPGLNRNQNDHLNWCFFLKKNRHLDWSFFQSSSWLIFFKKIVILIFIWKGENPQGWVDHWTSSLQTLHVEQWWQVLIRVDLYLCHLRATFRATFHVFSSRFYMLRKPLNHTWAVGSPHNSPATRRRNM